MGIYHSAATGTRAAYGAVLVTSPLASLSTAKVRIFQECSDSSGSGEAPVIEAGALIDVAEVIRAPARSAPSRLAGSVLLRSTDFNAEDCPVWIAPNATLISCDSASACAANAQCRDVVRNQVPDPERATLMPSCDCRGNFTATRHASDDQISAYDQSQGCMAAVPAAPPSMPPPLVWTVQATFTIEGDVSEFDVSAFQERLSVLLGAPVFAEDISVQPASIKVEVTIGMPDAASALHAAETLNDAEDLSTSLGVTVLGAHADAEAASPMPPPPTPPRAPYDDKLGAATIAAIVVPVALVLLVLGGLVGWVMLARPQSDAVYREHLQDVEMRGGGYTTGRNAALSASACNHPRDQTGNAPSQHVALAKTDSAVSGAI